MVVVVGAEGRGRRKARKKEEQIVRLESVEWSLRQWWMYGDFSSFNFPGVEGHNLLAVPTIQLLASGRPS